MRGVSWCVLPVFAMVLSIKARRLALHHRLSRWCTLAVCVGTFGWTAPAIAAEDEPVVIRGATGPSPAEHQREPTSEFQVGRELMWSRITLSDDADLVQASAPGARSFSLLHANIDMRNELWLATPRAMTSVASAVGSMVTGGISVVDVWRGNHLRQRHSMRAFFRTSGIKLVWKIEF